MSAASIPLAHSTLTHESHSFVFNLFSSTHRSGRWGGHAASTVFARPRCLSIHSRAREVNQRASHDSGKREGEIRFPPFSLCWLAQTARPHCQRAFIAEIIEMELSI